jgi:hypothetical protein
VDSVGAAIEDRHMVEEEIADSTYKDSSSSTSIDRHVADFDPRPSIDQP